MKTMTVIASIGKHGERGQRSDLQVDQLNVIHFLFLYSITYFSTALFAAIRYINELNPLQLSNFAIAEFAGNAAITTY
jgi:hypothetical protein